MRCIFALSFLFAFSGIASAQDRCGCEQQVKTSAGRCGSDHACQERAMSEYYKCRNACYPQKSDPGARR
jgi:hypothetical protein